MQKPAAAPLVRAEWRIALDKENLRRLDSEVEAVLDKQVQNIHPKDNIPAIEKLLRTEDYCSMIEVRNAFAKSEKIKLGMMEKTFLNIKEAINTASGPLPAQPSGANPSVVPSGSIDEDWIVGKIVSLLEKRKHSDTLETLGKTARQESPSAGDSRRAATYTMVWDNATATELPVTSVLLFPKAATGIAVAAPATPTEPAVQQQWRIAAEGVVDSRVALKDRHGTATLGLWRPDFVMYTRAAISQHAPNPVGSIEGVGELKADNITLCADDNRGQVVHYCREVLERQPARQFIYGFLANSTHIAFFRVTNDKVVYTTALPLAEGTLWLRGLLVASQEQLGSPPLPPIVSGSNYIVPGACIGQGRSSVAYQALLGSNSVVYKLFRSQEAFAAEESVLGLALLSPLAAAGRIPKLVAKSPADRVLVIAPLATQLARHPSSSSPRLTAPHAAHLIETLRLLSEATIVHRDVSPANLYLLDSDKVLLADFGFAQMAVAPTPLAGTIRYAADDVLRAWIANAPFAYKPSHDLESAVKVIFSHRYNGLYMATNSGDMSAPDANARFATAMLAKSEEFCTSTKFLRKCLNAARTANYAEVARIVQELWAE